MSTFSSAAGRDRIKPRSAHAVERLVMKPGPWMSDRWVIVPGTGDTSRNLALGLECEATACAAVPMTRCEDETLLCSAHYAQWYGDGSPKDAGDWASTNSRKPLKRSRKNMLADRAIEFVSLPASVAVEIRFVVGMKVSRGEWTPNRTLLNFLETLVATALSEGSSSLTARSDGDWTFLMSQDCRPAQVRDIRAYSSTFFRELRLGLLEDPWAEDQWCWRGSFENLLSDSSVKHANHINWFKIEQAWLREAIKTQAKAHLIAGTRAWGTLCDWIKSFSNFSEYLSAESITAPHLVDRESFLDYLSWLRESGASPTAMSGANTVASVLSVLKQEGILSDLGSEVFLRRGENATVRIRSPRPFPQDIVDAIDFKVLEDPELHPTIRVMFKFNRRAGCRISELLTMPIDCIRRNGDRFWIEYFMSKTKTWRRFPIPDDLGALLLDQQAHVRRVYGMEAAHLFPSSARSNISSGITWGWSRKGVSEQMNKAFERNGVRQSTMTGETVTGSEFHRYRHTIGTALLNRGWTQPQVQAYLGHASPTMTANYAGILDTTLNDKMTEFEALEAEDRALRGLDGVDPTVEKLRAKFSFVLPDGLCELPSSMSCETRDNPCSGCQFFDDGGEEVQPVRDLQHMRLNLMISDIGKDDPKLARLNQIALDALSLGSVDEA